MNSSVPPKLASRTTNPWSPPPIVPRGNIEPQDLWPLSKQIDELGGEWTYQIFVYRAINFHTPAAPPLFYEPIYNFDRLGLEALLFQYARGLLESADDPGAVTLAFEVFPSFFDAEAGRVAMPAIDERSIGRHAVSVIGVEDLDTVVFRHGWPGWAPNGVGFVKRDYVERYAMEMWLGRACDRGPLADTAETLLTPPGKDEFQALWHRDRERSSFDGPSRELRFETYSCWSLQDENPAEVLVLLALDSVRVATGVLIHRPADGTSVLSDLFVWPRWRRRGFGTLLENFAATRAQVAGSQSLEICIWDADAVKGLDRATRFLSAKGYEIETFDNRQLAAIGQRSFDQA